jgi:hypothetical protein
VAVADELLVVFRAQVDQAIKEMKRVSKSTKETHSVIEKMGKSLQTAFIAPIAAKFAFNGIATAVRDMGKAYLESGEASEVGKRSIKDIETSWKSLQAAGGALGFEAGAPILNFLSQMAANAGRAVKDAVDLGNALDDMRKKGGNINAIKGEQQLLILEARRDSLKSAIKQLRAEGIVTSENVFDDQLAEIENGIKENRREAAANQDASRYVAQGQSFLTEKANDEKAIAAFYEKTGSGQLADIQKEIKGVNKLLDAGRLSEEGINQALVVRNNLWEKFHAAYSKMYPTTTEDSLGADLPKQIEYTEPEDTSWDREFDKMGDMKKVFADIEKEAAERAKNVKQAWAEAYQESYGMMKDTALMAYDSINEAENRRANQALANLEREASARFQAADREIAYKKKMGLDMSAEEEALNQEKLLSENDLNEKRAQIERQSFERDKQAALVRIAISTAEGIAAAWKSPAGALLIPMIIAANAAQAAIVASQQYPGLYQGGIVPPQGPNGGLYRLGDKNRAEAVIPLDRGIGSTYVVNFSGNVYGAGGKDEFLADIVEGIKRRKKTGALSGI